MLALHLALHLALSKQTQLAVRILAIVDNLSLLGAICDIVIVYVDLKIVLKDLFGVLCLQL
jgi:hypothetical protein